MKVGNAWRNHTHRPPQHTATVLQQRTHPSPLVPVKTVTIPLTLGRVRNGSCKCPKRSVYHGLWTAVQRGPRLPNYCLIGPGRIQVATINLKGCPGRVGAMYFSSKDPPLWCLRTPVTCTSRWVRPPQTCTVQLSVRWRLAVVTTSYKPLPAAHHQCTINAGVSAHKCQSARRAHPRRQSRG